MSRIQIGPMCRVASIAALAGIVLFLPILAMAMDSDGGANNSGPPPAVETLISDSAPVNIDSEPVVRLGDPEAYDGVNLYAMRGYYAPVGAHGKALGSGGPSGDALTCLTQAIYYEARSESLEGQEAVAQVVMNRMRMQEFPHTVCGVVYQGAERTTGCQFTFACDGSMSRPIEPAAWDRALAVARQALGGFVYQPMVDATHYHASWMTPYWSASLEKIRQIGGHIFYR